MGNKAKSESAGYKKSHIVIATFLIIILVWLFASTLHGGKTGTLSITLPIIQTEVDIDGKQKITTSSDNQKVEVTLPPGNHSVTLSHIGYVDWKKDFSILSSGNLTLSPIFITQNASGLIITKSDPDYLKIRNQITSDTLPTKDSPRVSEDKTATAWVEGETIFAKVGEKIYTVTQSATEIKNLYFYEDRTDNLIFSTGNAIYLIEVDKTGGQNFIPIYKGTNPYFIKGDLPNSNYIYVLEGENLMQVII